MKHALPSLLLLLLLVACGESHEQMVLQMEELERQNRADSLMLNDFGLINMNGRLYDPISSRFLSPDNFVQQPWNSQNFNRYSYCLNNPLKYNDPSGEFFLGSLLAAHLDLIHNIFSHGFNVSQYNWTKTINAWKIDMGMFKGDWKQIVNKWSWGIVNSALGNNIAHGLNLLGAVDGVSNMDGMVAIGGVTKGNSAFTIGHYSFGPKSYKATWKDHLFVHEYGHYMQSQLLGSSYLLTIGIPSLASTVGIGGNDHNSRWFEVDASRRGAKHFDKKYGSGAKGYIAGSADYFDISAFEKGRYTPYYNPRTKSYFQDKKFPIYNSSYSFWDLMFPAMTHQIIPSTLLNLIK